MKALRLPKTKAAVVAWDEAKAACDMLPLEASPEEDAALHKLLERAKRAVQAAFAEETADRNDPETARMVHPKDPWLRRLLETYG